jgi:Tlde1 domain
MEAHSGLGDLLDDPEHVNVRMRGATPPAVYELKLREKLFHGVQALRLSPIGNSQTSGRAIVSCLIGLLQQIAHKSVSLHV